MRVFELIEKLRPFANRGEATIPVYLLCEDGETRLLTRVCDNEDVKEGKSVLLFADREPRRATK